VKPAVAVRTSAPALGPGGAPRVSRAEVQLRARVVELEARLADVTRCLEAAERGGEEARCALAGSEQARHAAVLKVGSIEATRSWRSTAPLRRVGGRVRRLLRR